MNYVITDLEMNPIAKEYKAERKICRLEIIEIGAVIMDENFLILGEFKTLVKPEYNECVEKKYETMTGITTQMVGNAPKFTDAYKMFVDWCESYGSSKWKENCIY